VRPTTLVRLTLAGTRTDTLRVLLTMVSAALAMLIVLAATTVLAIPARPDVDSALRSDIDSMQYTNSLLREPGLRPGVAFALLLLVIPVLALAGQCARLGAPARDRRLAALRLAGATPGQTIRIAATETGLASLLGTVAGTAIYLVGRRLLHRPDAQGQLALPTDVLPSPGLLVAVGLGLPLLAALATALLLRRVVVTPFGVLRQTRRQGRPGMWPAVLIGLGLAACAALGPAELWFARADRPLPSGVFHFVLVAGGLLATLGVVLGTGWLSYASARLLHRTGRRPATLLAARRLMADPWTGSRTFAALLACVVFAGGAAGFRAWFVAQADLNAESQRRSDLAFGVAPSPVWSTNDAFYLRTLDLVDLAVAVALVIAAAGLLVSVVEGIVARRRTYAALVATGVPRSVLARAVAWQTLTPAVPAILLAVTVGSLLARGLTRGKVEAGGSSGSRCVAAAQLCADPATRERYTEVVEIPTITRSVPMPFDGLAASALLALVAVLATVGVGLLFLRASSSVEELRAG
jgi:hypothetical protein